MGQYYYVVNIDKKQYLYPHKMGDGLKLWEMAAAGNCGKGLILLLANGNGRGGGDFEEDPLVGSWCGDRIVVAGDYADKGVFVEDRELTEEELQKVDNEYGEREKFKRTTDFNLHNLASLTYEDISLKVREFLLNEGIKMSGRWDLH